MEVSKTRSTAHCIASLCLLTGHTSAQSAPADLSRQIAEVMSQGQSGKAHQRYVHAKGIVCQGTFQASPGAAAVSRAAHFNGNTIAITVRFSDGAPDTGVADNSPEASPRGMAIRFAVGSGTDIMAFSHNGFFIGTGEDFLAFVKAQAATDTAAPHPSPIEQFLSTHPRALKFVQDPKPIPESFGTESYYANNAFVFVNDQGHRQIGRYQIVPVDGGKYLDDATLKDKSPNVLSKELPGRLSAAPARFRLLLQLPNAGDQTNDASIVWPDDRKRIELGIITINSVVADSIAAERKLAFDPTHLTDGIELSDDPLPALRSQVYAYSVAGRHSK